MNGLPYNSQPASTGITGIPGTHRLELVNSIQITAKQRRMPFFVVAIGVMVAALGF
jgi:hypothetical protein